MPEQRKISSNAEKLLLPLELLLDELVSAGFARDRVGTPLRLRLLDLLDTMPVETTPEQLKYKLSALICYSAEEQHKFYTLFEGFVERFRAQETAEPITPPAKKDDDAPAKPETPPAPPKGETPQKAPAAPKKGSHQTDSVKAARSGPITVALHFRDDGYRPWNLPALESVVRPMREKELTGAEEWDIPKTINQSIRAGGAPLFARRRRRKAPQYLFLIEQKSARDHLAGFYADLVSELSRRDLDAEYYFYDRIPRQCWKDRRDPSTYTTVDRLNALYQQSRLILIGEADGLLAVSQVPGVKAEQVSTKIHLYPSELAFQLRETWPAVALLNTRSTPLWGDVETAIHQLFPVAPANAAGLGSLMEQWKNRTSFRPYYWKLENPEPVPPSFQHHDGDPETIQKDIKSLKSYLGRQGYTWLCAIAVYPEIYWQLTKILHDEAISAVDVPDESLRTQLWHLFLLRLSRLEWLRQGIIPAEYRNILRKDLPDANAVEVRRQLLEVLQLHENKPPEGSYAEKDRAYTVALFDHERYVTLEKPDQIRLAAMQEKLRQAVNDAGVAASDIEDAVGRSLFRSLPDMPAETVKNYWVLWVDDSPKNNESFQSEMTQEHAIQFVNATHTQQAFEILQGQTFDLIISDVSRHGDKEAGIKMIRRFRENGITLPILFFTHPNYVKQHRELLMGFGAVEVTSGFTQLRPSLLEALQQKAAGNVESLKKIQFLEAAKQAGRAVCRVILPDGLLGTGFLTQGNYLFTCSFLIDSPEKAKNTRVEFNVDQDAQGNLTEPVAYQLDPSDFMSSPVNNLDFTRVRIIDREDAPLSQWGYLDVGPATLPEKGEQVCLIHHLRGEAKQAELNEALGVEGQYFYYGENSPSSPGSSGAPVLNQDLQVVAIHRARKTNTIVLGEKRTIREAIVLKDVLAYIQKETPQTATSSPESEQILQADTLLEQGQAAYQNRNFEAAESFFQQAQEVYTAAAHEAGRANAQHDLGKVLLATGRLKAAKQALESALAIYYKLGFQSSQAFVLMDLGMVGLQLAEYDPAEQLYQEALERLESLSGDVAEDIVVVWQALGAISRAKGDLDAAKKRLLNALKESRKAGLKALELPVLIQLGDINLMLGDANQALGCFGDALELAENDTEKAEIQERLAEVHELDGQPRKAIEALNEAWGIYAKAGNTEAQARVTQQLQRLAEEEKGPSNVGSAAPPYQQTKMEEPPMQSVFEQNKTKLFLLCAPEDDEYSKGVFRHLNMVKGSDRLSMFNIRDTPEGENAMQRARFEIEQADYIVMFVSVNLLGDKAWVKMAYNALKTGKRLLPIMIQRVNLEGTGFEKLETLPRGSRNKAISEFEDREDAYFVIARGMAEIMGVGDGPAVEVPSNVGDSTAEEVMEEINPDPESDINKQKIRTLISQANLREALELLRKALPGDNTVVLLLGQLATLEKNEIRGILNFEDASRTRAQISYAALELAGTLPDEKAETNKADAGPDEKAPKDSQKNDPDPFADLMIPIQGGTFQMGDTFRDGEADEKPVHSVTLSDFQLCKYLVTQGQWKAIMGDNPSSFKGDDLLPVEQVSWDDAQVFIKKLNEQTGKAYRLPTEAEWEYAARGGSRSKSYTYAGGNNLGEVGWSAENTGSKTHKIGQKNANELGLFDMSGNVWEWCADWYGAYPTGAQNNPNGPETGSLRVYRGGSWLNYAQNCRVVARNYSSPVIRNLNVGFRLAFSIQSPA